LVLAGVKALLAKLSAVRTANDVGHDGLAPGAFISGAQKLTCFQDELVQDGNGVLRGGLERVSIVTRLSFVLQLGDFLHELEQGRLRFRGFDHSFQRRTVVGEL